MKSIELTIQNLIGSGMDPKTENNPYLGFIYTSFQERATKVSHGNTARHALEFGDEVGGGFAFRGCAACMLCSQTGWPTSGRLGTHAGAAQPTAAP